MLPKFIAPKRRFSSVPKQVGIGHYTFC